MTSTSLLATPLTLLLGPRNRMRRALSTVHAAANPASVGTCQACVTALDDSHAIRYHGDYYHAGPCQKSTPRPHKKASVL